MTLQIRIDPALIESAVFLDVRRLEAAGDEQVMRAYRWAVEPLYEREWRDDDERELAFRDVHAEWFRRLGLEARVVEALAEFPLLARELEQLAVLRAVARKEESSELFVRPDDREPGRTVRNAAIRMRGETLGSEAVFRPWIRRELYHLEDMVDPLFGYRPDLRMAGADAPRENLVRDRYRVLWDAWIDVRLRRAGRLPESAPSTAIPGFDRVFRSVEPAERERIVRKLRDSEHLRHDDLVTLANEEDARDLASGEASPVSSVNPRA